MKSVFGDITEYKNVKIIISLIYDITVHNNVNIVRLLDIAIHAFR
jgi:hypothetical protein